MAEDHREKVEVFDHHALKLAYFQGVLDVTAAKKSDFGGGVIDYSRYRLERWTSATLGMVDKSTFSADLAV